MTFSYNLNLQVKSRFKYVSLKQSFGRFPTFILADKLFSLYLRKLFSLYRCCVFLNKIQRWCRSMLSCVDVCVTLANTVACEASVQLQCHIPDCFIDEKQTVMAPVRARSVFHSETSALVLNLDKQRNTCLRLKEQQLQCGMFVY